VARLTVGVPVKNGAHLLKFFFNSLLSQSFSDFTVLISDNCSDDDTGDICLNYCQKDSRIKYIRQANDIGIAKNVDLVLYNCDTEFFTWWPVDDLRESENFKLNIDVLDANLDAVGSGSRYRYETEPLNITHGIDVSSEKPSNRVLKIVESFHGTSGLTFSIFRSSHLKDFKPPFYSGEYYANDVSRLAFLLLRHKIITLNTGGAVTLGVNGISSQSNPFSKYRKTNLELIMPYYFVSKYLLDLAKNNFELKYYVIFIYKLLEINLSALKMILSRCFIHSYTKLIQKG